MEIEFLGTGTSTGVPQLRCCCEVCTSDDKRDNRLRASAIVRVNNHSILIDCGPDFRAQILRASDSDLDAMLITHSHYDHVGGVDDLRPYCSPDNPFPIFCQENVATDLRNRVPYCFATKRYPGVPAFDINIVKEDVPFTFERIEIE
ncbi:MAG: MBL fold metallo-hydrolase, partial [Bacteroidales bacterium]